MKFFLWFKYIFDFNNFKEYYKVKPIPSDTNFDQSITNLEQKIQELTNKFMQESALSKNSFEQEIKNLKEISETHNLNLKNKLEDEVKNLKEVSLLSSKNLRFKFEDEIKNLKEISHSNTTTLKSKFEDEVKTLRDFSNSNASTLKSKFEDEVKSLKEMTETHNQNLKGKLEDEIKSLKELDQKNEKFLNENKALSLEIKNIFENNKARGKIGELFFETILENYLGARAKSNLFWEKQYTFKNGKMVDFVIKHPNIDKMIPIDAKFPLKEIEAYWNEEGTAISQNVIKKLREEIKIMIRDINHKYVQNLDETTDFALMFIPSESVYNFLLDEINDLFEFGNKNNVYLCSPTNILAILSTYLLVTRKISWYENLNPIIKEIENIGKEYKRLFERWNEEIKYIDRLKTTMDNLTITFRKINKRTEQISDYNEKFIKENEENITPSDKISQQSQQQAITENDFTKQIEQIEN